MRGYKWIKWREVISYCISNFQTSIEKLNFNQCVSRHSMIERCSDLTKLFTPQMKHFQNIRGMLFSPFFLKLLHFHKCEIFYTFGRNVAVLLSIFQIVLCFHWCESFLTPGRNLVVPSFFFFEAELHFQRNEIFNILDGNAAEISSPISRWLLAWTYDRMSLWLLTPTLNHIRWRSLDKKIRGAKIRFMVYLGKWFN